MVNYFFQNLHTTLLSRHENLDSITSLPVSAFVFAAFFQMRVSLDLAPAVSGAEYGRRGWLPVDLVNLRAFLFC